MNSELKAIQNSRSEEESKLKVLQQGLINGQKERSKDPVPAYADYVPSDSDEQLSQEEAKVLQISKKQQRII